MKILFALLSYLFGALPSGFLVFLLSEKKDIRAFGSRSTGATNVLRLKGWKYAVPVMLIDIIKGFLPVFLAARLFPDTRFPLICAFLAVLGHCYPVYIRFRGGKGVATTIGALAAIDAVSLGIALLLFLAVVALTRFVSLGSLTAALSLAPAAWALGRPMDQIVLCASLFLLIAVRHSGNIGRLLKGTERKLGRKE